MQLLCVLNKFYRQNRLFSAFLSEKWLLCSFFFSFFILIAVERFALNQPLTDAWINQRMSAFRETTDTINRM